MRKRALFRFEASSTIGAGHAMRSCVIADELTAQGWNCSIITSEATYNFIKALKRFPRIEPEVFESSPQACDLLVIDHYDMDATYERQFKLYAKKIMVIDDLANRRHDCDILLDQTYGRTEEEYKLLVPEHCQILTGSDYVLLRKDFIEMRLKALEKRSHTKETRRILISMGGSNPKDFILIALKMVKQENFKGEIDIVLGFQEEGKDAILAFLKNMDNVYRIHVNPNMVQLMYEADLVIGAAGSSVWERCCLGVPQILLQTAENQSRILSLFCSNELKDFLDNSSIENKQKMFSYLIDGLGIRRVLCFVTQYLAADQTVISLKKIKKEDMNWVYQCQQIPNLREFSFNKSVPSYEEHKQWFQKKIDDPSCVFEKIVCGEEPCGVLRLDYESAQKRFILSWYILPRFQKKGIGTLVLNLAKHLVSHKIVAFAFDQNIASHKALRRAGFLLVSKEENGAWYEY